MGDKHASTDLQALSAAIAAIADPILALKVKNALMLIRRAFALYTPQQMAFSFNGGKDSTVLLHLLREVAWQHSGGAAGGGDGRSGLAGVRSFLFTRPDDFPELEDFVKDSDSVYGLQVEYLADPDFKKGLVEYLERTKVQAILLGTRKDDPNATHQQFYCPSSDGWPAFMRINPIFDWTYHDVWCFLRAVQVPYCSLYDQGYTSLGGRYNTLPNSALRREDGGYAPAHMLTDGRLERSGRSSAASKAADEAPGAEPSSVGPDTPKGQPGDELTAALLMVGDELLAGKVADTNATYLCKELRAIGYTVAKIVVVPDKAEVIAAEVRSLSNSVAVLLTCGGIGPTLDDVTMEGVAQGLGTVLSRHPDFESRLRSMFGNQITAAHLKMAETPTGSTALLDYTLDTGEVSKFPLLRCGSNIFVLPGVPHLMRQKWRAVKELLLQGRPLMPFHNQVFRLSVWDETKIATALEAVQKEVGAGVAIGSYPVTSQTDGAHILVTLDSKEEAPLRVASLRMRELLPEGSILSEQQDVATLSPSPPPSAAAAQP